MNSAESKEINKYKARLSRVFAYLDDHLTETVDVETLAAEACFSPFHFHRIFTAIFREPVMTYVRRLRLEKAASLLIHRSGKSVTEVAFEVGFSSSAGFAKAFKDHFGVSATQWRKEQFDKFSKIGKVNRNPEQALNPGFFYLDGKGPVWAETVFSKQGEKMDYTIAVDKLEPITVAYIRHHGSYSHSMQEPHDKLFKWAGARGLIGSETKSIGMALDDPDVTPAEKCRYDDCLSVPVGTEASGEVENKTIPGGMHAVARYEGPMEEIGNVYQAMYGQWLPKSGFEPNNSPAYQFYRSGPEEFERNLHIFDLCLPVKPL